MRLRFRSSLKKTNIRVPVTCFADALALPLNPPNLLQDDVPQHLCLRGLRFSVQVYPRSGLAGKAGLVGRR